MSGFDTSNGAKWFVNPTAIDTDTIDDPTDLTSLTGWVQVKGAKDLSSFGDESASVTSNQLDANRTLKSKGTRDAGTPGFVFDIKDSDPGQLALATMELTDFDYPMYIEYDNKKTPNGTNGKRYFAGKVMSIRENPGAANNALTATANVGINTAIYRVRAT